MTSFILRRILTMPRSKVKKSNKKHVVLDFKTKATWQKHKLRPGSQRYNKMIKNRFGLGRNAYFDSMTDSEKQERRHLESQSGTAAKTYLEFSQRQSDYRKALNELYQDTTFRQANQEERVQMMIEAQPSLASATTADKKSFDLSMSLLAYEDRENLINNGEFVVIKAKQYRDNYLAAISSSGMPVNDSMKQAIRDVPDEDLEYFVNELLPPLPDWYGMQGSTLQPAVEFIGNLQRGVEFYNANKGGK